MDDAKTLMPVIMLISDVHCQYELINVQIDHAEKILGHPVNSVIVLGDLGFFENSLRKYFRTEGRRFKRKVFFIEGNHEDFGDLIKWVDAYSPYITYLPRGNVQWIDGYRILSLGGAAYMDAMMTPEASEIHDIDIDHCLQHEASDVDIILTHDCPTDIGVPNSPGFDAYGTTGFPRSNELIDHFNPPLWVFGHHHKWFDTVIQQTHFVGLAESWNGFALLKPGFDLTVVYHPVPKPMGFWESLRIKYFKTNRNT